jgi:hypothetical protein
MMPADGPHGDPSVTAAPARPRLGRRRAAAALPELRRDGRRAGRTVRVVLGGDDVFRAAVVRGLRVGQADLTESAVKNG